MAKGPILREIWDSLPNERKQRARKDELDAEYLALQELRTSAGLTQARM